MSRWDKTMMAGSSRVILAIVLVVSRLLTALTGSYYTVYATPVYYYYVYYVPRDNSPASVDIQS